MITLKETCSILGIGEYTLKRWVEEEKIKCTYIEKEMYFEEKEVNNFIEKTKIKLIKPQDYFDILDNNLSLDGDEIKIDVSSLDIDSFLSYMSEKNKTLNSEDISKLIENMKC